ncbi:unnamed protein product, partial [Symbiodinium sp. KB8]
VKSLEEKLNASAENHSGANVRIKELEDKQEETQGTVEDLCPNPAANSHDLQQQLAVLTEERDVARAREEELFELLNEKEEQLMDTNQGYVNLTDQLNDLREELEEKIDEQAQMLDTLGERNQARLYWACYWAAGYAVMNCCERRLMDQGIKLREELSESKRKLAEARLRAQNSEAMPNLLQRMGSESAFKGVPSDETDGTDGSQVSMEPPWEEADAADDADYDGDDDAAMLVMIADGQSLDSSHIEGFRLNEVMNEWYYSNPDPANPTQEVRNGAARLPSFSLRLRSPTTLEFGDEIHIISPSDFYLIDTQGRCRGFRWIDPTAVIPVATFTPLPNSIIMCNASAIAIYIREPTPVERDYYIEFGLDIYNPLKTPPLTDNFWQCTVYSANSDANGNRIIKASKAFQSWDIVPQLENLEVRLLGPNTAAETLSSIHVEFTPVTTAEDIAIQFHEPMDFDFSAASTEDEDNQVIFLREGPLLRIRMDIVQGVRTAIVLRNVLLGKVGGQTDISITTWTGGLFQNGIWLPGTKQDERLNFRNGFRLPGRVEILYDKLENTFQRDPFTYPEQSLWNTQMGRPAYAEFHFHISVQAEVGDFLMISAWPFQPTRSIFTLVESPIGQSISSNAVVKKAVANEITTVFGGQVHARLLEPLIPYRRYEVVTSVIAPTAQATKDHGAVIQWFIETRDLGQLPTNTNDGNSREFPIVEEYRFMVSAVRSPPLASIIVSLDVTPALDAPTLLRVIAPLGFNFTENCIGPGDSVYIESCVPGQVTPSGRSTAELTVRGAPAVGLEGMAVGILVRIDSPTQTPVAKEWFIEGVDALSDRQLGWGQADGIDVLPMQDTMVIYPGFTGVRSRIVWRFRTREMVQAGGYLEVRLPFGFAPECSMATLEAIALPITGGCRVVNEALLYVFMNTTMVPREYVFAFFLTPPAATPLFNDLSIILRDRFGAVSDAAVSIPGSKVLDKLRIREGQLLWTSTKPFRESTITVSFDILESLPDLIVAPDQQIDEILITLPYGFVHLVEKPTDLQLMNENMPLREVDYLDYFQKDRIRISLELNQSS